MEIKVLGLVFKGTVFEDYKQDNKFILEKGLINH